MAMTLHCALLLFALSVLPAALTINTVSDLKVNKYLGRWFQMYSSSIVDLWFERGAVCVTADYGVNPNKTVSVLNSERIDTPDGALKVILGYATPTSEPGKLGVSLQGVPIKAPYWVVKLGPESFGDQQLYEYSVVTDNLSASLFVLARDPATFRQNYQSEVLDFLDKNGFTKTYNKPRETLQSAQCQYNPPPSTP